MFNKISFEMFEPIFQTLPDNPMKVLEFLNAWNTSFSRFNISATHFI